MNRIGPFVGRLLAVTPGDGTVILHGRPPGPAGLATVDLAGGAATIAVDVIGPDNLVSLSIAEPHDPRALRVLEVLLDREVFAAVRSLDLGAEAEQVVWDGDPVAQDSYQLSPAERADRRRLQRSRLGGLGRVGRLALVASELTRVDRSDLATALGLFELATEGWALGHDFEPVPSAGRALAAAVARARDLDLLSETAIRPEHADLLLDRIGTWTRSFDNRDSGVADALRRIDALVRGARSDEPGLRVAADLESSADAMVTATAIRLDRVPAAAAAHVGARPIARGGEPLEVLVDPSTDLSVTSAVLADDHLLVTGEGNPLEVWLRAFDRTPPVILAMAPATSTSIGRWTARAILPAGCTARTIHADLTTHPAEPWRGALTRRIAEATTQGAEAASLTRRADAAAPDAWDRNAQSWWSVSDKPRGTAAVLQAEDARYALSQPVEADALATDLVD